MSSKVSKSNIERIDEVISWYESTDDWLQQLAASLHSAASHGAPLHHSIPADILFLTPDDINTSLSTKQEKLSTAASMQLFSACEGSLRFDADTRKRKRNVGKLLKALLATKKHLKDVDLDDVIDCWCQSYSIPVNRYSTFKGLFKYRNWLAHGKYWDDINPPVALSAITPHMIYQVFRKCFDDFKNQESDFEW